MVLRHVIHLSTMLVTTHPAMLVIIALTRQAIDLSLALVRV